jgi:hypothetical protein
MHLFFSEAIQRTPKWSAATPAAGKKWSDTIV